MIFRDAFRVSAAGVLALGAMSAQAETQVDVTYTNPTLDFGPLSLGLNALPSEVNFSILLSTDPIFDVTYFSLGDVQSVDMAFGDGAVAGLSSFTMIINAGVISTLSYTSLPFNSPTADGPVVLNFPLNISGTTQPAGGGTPEAFSYTYANSDATYTVVPEPSAAAALLACGALAVARRRRRG